MELCDVILQTNRVRYVFNMEILDLLNEESVSGVCSGRASLSIRREVLLQMFKKVSRSVKYDSNIFFIHKHIWTPQPITLTRSRCMCGVIIALSLMLHIRIRRVISDNPLYYNITITYISCLISNSIAYLTRLLEQQKAGTDQTKSDTTQLENKSATNST